MKQEFNILHDKEILFYKEEQTQNANTIQKKLDELININADKYIYRAINKFITDIRTCKETINSALFISLGTENIPYKGPYHFEKTGNIPTYYVFGHEKIYIVR